MALRTQTGVRFGMEGGDGASRGRARFPSGDGPGPVPSGCLGALSRLSQFPALVVGYVGHRHSLRDIESALMNEPSLLYHLSTRSVSRSALARGNEKLNADFFQELFGLLYTRLQSSGSVPSKRFRFKGKLFFRWIKQNLKIRPVFFVSA